MKREKRGELGKGGGVEFGKIFKGRGNLGPKRSSKEENEDFLYLILFCFVSGYFVSVWGYFVSVWGYFVSVLICFASV